MWQLVSGLQDAHSAKSRNNSRDVIELVFRKNHLDGKVAIVTGGASGIGRACSSLFASECAKLAICDIKHRQGKDLARQLRRRGRHALFIQTDVSIAEQSKRMIEKTVDAYGGIDILVNNAGIAHPSPILETTEDEWNRVIDVNLKSAFLASKYAAPFLKRRHGVILNISSDLALVGKRNRSAYSAAKGGLLSLTRALAAELAIYGIRVNCICPGPIATPMMRAVYHSARSKEDLRSELERIPIGRFGSPEEVAEAALFLVSSAASYITGAILPVDGGETAVVPAGRTRK